MLTSPGRDGSWCVAPPPHLQEEHVFKAFLNSIVIVPVLLGVFTAANVRGKQAAWLLVGLVLAYNLAYLVVLYYLKIRWVG
jgi:hypothetical protein